MLYILYFLAVGPIKLFNEQQTAQENELVLT